MHLLDYKQEIMDRIDFHYFRGFDSMTDGETNCMGKLLGCLIRNHLLTKEQEEQAMQNVWSAMLRDAGNAKCKMYHFGLTVFYGMQSRKKDFSDICDQVTKLIRPPHRSVQPTMVTKATEASPKEPIRACVPSDIYCDVCSIQFHSQPSFFGHMSTKEHILTLEQNGKLPLGLYEEFKKALLLTKWFTFAIPPMTTTLHEEKLRLRSDQP